MAEVLTQRHKLFELALRDREMYPVIAYGSAGTGKTYMAAQAAVEWLREGGKRQVVVTRPNVSFAQGNGFLPGTEREKMEPWVAPVLQYLEEFSSEGAVRDWEKRGRLIFKPLEFIPVSYTHLTLPTKRIV